jgi:hypothetical protein
MASIAAAATTAAASSSCNARCGSSRSANTNPPAKKQVIAKSPSKIPTAGSRSRHGKR